MINTISNIVAYLFIIFLGLAIYQKLSKHIYINKAGWIAVGLFFLLAFLIPGGNNSTRERRESQGESSPVEIAKRIEIIKCHWHKDGYGQVAIIDSITIENKTNTTIKDVKINFDFFSNSGTKLNNIEYTFYDTFPANKSKTFFDLNIGLINAQSTKMQAYVNPMWYIEHFLVRLSPGYHE